MTLVIRDPAPDDETAWRGLWSSYLAFYDTVLPAQVTSQTWARLMDPASRMKARFAFVDGVLLGFGVHHYHCSTWVIGDDCYLEDLFVAQEARGQGVGRALIEDLKTIAKSKGWSRLYWHTDEGNATARALYDSFAPSDGHIRYRLAL